MAVTDDQSGGQWPKLDALARMLDELDGRVVTVTKQPANSSGLSERDIDEIHAGLLKKQRAGSLGLNK